MKLLFLIAIMLMSLSTNVLAESYTCMNDSISQYSTTIIVSGSSIPISYNDTCSFGCQVESGKCKPSPYEINQMDVGLLFGMIVFAIIMFYISFKLGSGEGSSEEDLLKVHAFKIFFFMAGLIFLMASQLIMINYVSMINKTSSMGFIEDMLWFILAIIVISFVVLFLLVIKDAMNLIAQKKLFKIRW